MTPEERLAEIEARIAELDRRATFLENLYRQAQEWAMGPGKKLLKILGLEKLP